MLQKYLIKGAIYEVETFPDEYEDAIWDGQYFFKDGKSWHYDDMLNIRLVNLPTLTDEAVKYDSKKTRLELIPPEMINALGEILTFGANKYEERNWEKGMAWSRCYGALQRHLWSWWSGENNDPETGKSHLWHASCCLAFLVAYEARGTGEDDRA
jgi:hypothetical protein